MVHIVPVVETPRIKEGEKAPWPVIEVPGLQWAPLEPSNLACLGTFMLQLCYGLEVRSVDEAIEVIRESDELGAYGGFQFTQQETVISPSCCSGLEYCHEWLTFLHTGASPWMGHEPFGWAEKVGNEVIIWSDGSSTSPRQKLGPSIAAPISEFELALASAGRLLQDFLNSVPDWLSAVGRADAADIVPKILDRFCMDPAIEEALRRSLGR
jgi:hypothetical protein